LFLKRTQIGAQALDKFIYDAPINAFFQRVPGLAT
jgi:hypothetical protein